MITSTDVKIPKQCKLKTRLDKLWIKSCIDNLTGFEGGVTVNEGEKCLIIYSNKKDDLEKKNKYVDIGVNGALIY